MKKANLPAGFLSLLLLGLPQLRLATFGINFSPISTINEKSQPSGWLSIAPPAGLASIALSYIRHKLLAHIYYK
jgi:hypothetical protein